MSDVVLFQPKIGSWDIGSNTPPLGLLSIARFLPREYNVSFIDQRKERNWEKRLEEEVGKEPFCVAITCMTGPQISYALKAAQEVKEVNARVKIVWGGVHSSLLPLQTLRSKYVDIVCIGEGELTFPELVEALKTKKDLDKIKGIGYKKGKRSILTGRREFADMNSFPEPSYDLVDIKKYLRCYRGEKYFFLETSRGCVFNCGYCYNRSFNFSRFRCQSSSKIIERIKYLSERFKIENFRVIDDNFFLNPGSYQVLDALKDFKFIIEGADIRVCYPSKKRLFSILERGAKTDLFFGVESGSPKIQKLINKNLDPTIVRKFNKEIARFPICVRYNFMCGFPGETLNDLRLSIKLALKLIKDNPHAMITPFNIFVPYPGTPLFEVARNHGWLPPSSLEGWSSHDLISFKAPWISEKYWKIIKGVHFLSYFIDNKAHYYSPENLEGVLVKLIHLLYMGRARELIEKLRWSFLEEKIFQFLNI